MYMTCHVLFYTAYIQLRAKKRPFSCFEVREIAEATRQIGNMELTEMVVALMGAKDAVPYNAFSELLLLWMEGRLNPDLLVSTVELRPRLSGIFNSSDG